MANIAGLWALNPPDKPIYPVFFKDPLVDGVAIRSSWQVIEPVRGELNWSYIDAQVENCQKAGKKASLSIQTGWQCPQWLYVLGAQPFSYVDEAIGSYASSDVRMFPIPWDPVFLAEWGKFVWELGRHIKTLPTGSLTALKVTGIGWRTDEWMLPRGRPKAVSVPGKPGWTTTDDIATWLKSGYTRIKVADAAESILENWANVFRERDILLSLQIVPSMWPPINNDGQLQAGLGDDALTQISTSLARILFDRKCCIQNNGLMADWAAKTVKELAGKTITGYQALDRVLDEPKYRCNRGVVGDQKNILIAVCGQTTGANFLELYPRDATGSPNGVADSALRDRLSVIRDTLLNTPYPG